MTTDAEVIAGVLAPAMWLADGYDLDADPNSSTARELRPEYERKAAHVAAALVEAGVGVVAEAQAAAWDAGWLCRDVGSNRNPYRADRLAP